MLLWLMQMEDMRDTDVCNLSTGACDVVVTHVTADDHRMNFVLV